MISQIAARRYRCLRDTDQELGPLEVLVGPNGSGKSALMDVIAFVGSLVSVDLNRAITERTNNFHDLVWGLDAGSFEIAIEARIPEQLRSSAFGGEWSVARYEVAVRIDPLAEVVSLASEKVTLSGSPSRDPLVVAKRKGQEVRYRAETKSGTGHGINRPPNLSALAGLPEGESSFPVTVWLARLLRDGIQQVKLNTRALAQPSPPFKSGAQMYDGSYLVRFVAHLQQEHPGRFADWLQHVRTSLPDLSHVQTVLRPEDQHRYLRVRFENGFEIPSWALSEGTLRLLALTILAYVPGFRGIYLIEEPENGVHPTALETIFQSLSSVYDGQVLLATHSPVFLSLAKPAQLLCFTKTSQGTQIIRGDKHPALQDWKGEVNLSDFFAAGVLG